MQGMRPSAVLVAVTLALATGVTAAGAKVVPPIPRERAAGFVMRFDSLQPGYTRPTPEQRRSNLPPPGSLGLLCRTQASSGRACIGATGMYSDTQLNGEPAQPSIISVNTSLGTWESRRQWENEYVERGSERVRVRGTRGYLARWSSSQGAGFYLKWMEARNAFVSIDANFVPGDELSRRDILALADDLRRVPVRQLDELPVEIGAGKGRIFDEKWSLVAVSGSDGSTCPGVLFSGFYFDECGTMPARGQIAYQWVGSLNFADWLVGVAGPGVAHVRFQSAYDNSKVDVATIRATDGSGARYFAILAPRGRPPGALMAFDREDDQLTHCSVTPGEFFDGLRDC